MSTVCTWLLKTQTPNQDIISNLYDIIRSHDNMQYVFNIEHYDSRASWIMSLTPCLERL